MDSLFREISLIIRDFGPAIKACRQANPQRRSGKEGAAQTLCGKGKEKAAFSDLEKAASNGRERPVSSSQGGGKTPMPVKREPLFENRNCMRTRREAPPFPFQEEEECARAPGVAQEVSPTVSSNQSG